MFSFKLRNIVELLPRPPAQPWQDALFGCADPNILPSCPFFVLLQCGAAGKIWKLGGLSFKGGKYDVSACPSADTRINNSAGADIPHYYQTPIKTTIKYQASKLNIQDSTHSSAVKYPKLNSLKMAHLHRTLSFKRVTFCIILFLCRWQCQI